MGAPVYDAKTKTYAGMFDIRDILSCVNVAHREFDLLMSGVEYSREPVGTDSDGHNMYLKMQREGLDQALKLLYTTGNTPIPVTVTYIAARNPMSPVFYTNESSLLDICKVLTNRHSHRVCIGASSPLRSGKLPSLKDIVSSILPSRFCGTLSLIILLLLSHKSVKRYSLSPTLLPSLQANVRRNRWMSQLMTQTCLIVKMS
jgi:hypothetical protein